jgi:ABC-2 type transport system permease protein
MRAAVEEAWANRAGFWTQVLTMVVNDIVWVIFWILFFRRVGEIRGWDGSSVLLLLSVLTTSAGFVLGCLSNCRALGRLVVDGEIDAALALPVPPLRYLLVRKLTTTNLGDVAFGLVLFVMSGSPSVERTLVFVAGCLVSGVLLTGFLVTTSSLAFFAGRNDIGEISFHTMLVFSSYPIDVFTGAAKLFLYTVIPAGFIAAVPARLIEDFDWGLAALLLAVAFAFAFAGWLTFTLGLRRYTSGAVWTRA